MKRKLVKQGAATLMISLPSKWIKENKLDKGDEVELQETNKKLMISINPENSIKETEVTLHSTRESAVRTIITNIYRQGYDKVKVNFKDKSSLKIIESTVSTQLLGFEIVKKTPEGCIIENITEPSKDQFKNIFSKMMANIEDILDLTKSALEGNKISGFIETEQKIKEFDNFCRRIISKEEVEKENFQLDFHQELIHAQRNLYYLLRFSTEHKLKSGKFELEMFGYCRQMFEMLKEAYYNKKIETIEKMHDLASEVYHRGYALLLKPNTNSVIIFNLMNASRGFYLASSPLVGFSL